MSAVKKVLVVLAVYVLGLILLLLSGQRSVGVAVIIAGFLSEAALFRCPHCGRRLGRSFWPGKHCPHCGEIIE